MTNQKNVTEQTNTQKSIEFSLQLSPEQYEIYELLAKLNNQELQAYIHQKIIDVAGGTIRNIEDPKEKEWAERVFRAEGSALDMDQTIILHGFYDSTSTQLEAAAVIGKALGYDSPSEFLQWAIRSGAKADMDHLAVFEGAHDMKETLKEA